MILIMRHYTVGKLIDSFHSNRTDMKNHILVAIGLVDLDIKTGCAKKYVILFAIISTDSVHNY